MSLETKEKMIKILNSYKPVLLESSEFVKIYFSLFIPYYTNGFEIIENIKKD